MSVCLSPDTAMEGWNAEIAATLALQEDRPCCNPISKKNAYFHSGLGKLNAGNRVSECSDSDINLLPKFQENINFNRNS